MEAFDFNLPISKNDLLKRTAARQYVVDEIIGHRHLPGALEDFRLSMKSGGYLTILQKFDVPFSILCSDAESSLILRETTWQVLLKGLSSFGSGLQRLLQSPTIPSDSQAQHLNALKMFCYLLCKLADGFEQEETKVKIVQGRKKRTTSTLQMLNWTEEREAVLKVILHVVEMDINKLWDPPVAEEDFINLITSFCYKLLENANVCRLKETKDTISNILGVLVKRHNRALSDCLRILQLLQHYEHTVGSLVQIVEVMVNQYNANKVVFEIMREIGRLDSRDIQNDSSGIKSYAQFLVELSANLPGIVLQNITFLIPSLDADSSTMRNCVLCIIKEIIIKVLSQENLEPTLKKTRDQFFCILKDYIHDVNTFVRSKVLQNWLQIVKERCLPLSHQEELVNLVLGRLDDKSASVRRYAIQLMTALLQMNPFAYSLQYEELKANYEKEAATLETLMADHSEHETTPQDPRLQQIDDDWRKYESDILKEFEVTPYFDSSDLEGLVADSDDNPIGIIKTIVDNIEKKDYRTSSRYLMAAKDAWPEVFLLETTESDSSDGQSSVNRISSQVIVTGLKTVYFELKKNELGIVCSIPEPVGDQQSEGPVVNEISKQQVLVLYLKDSLTFSGQVKTAIPVLCKMLRSKVNSDILEAIEFFVASFEFGLSYALTGIRRILLLLYSAKEAVVKEAAVNAYKRIYLNPKGGNQRANALKIINNLTALMTNASLEEFISLDMMMCQFMKSGELDCSVIQMLWERFTMKVPNTSPEESRAALNLLTMAAGADTEIIKSNIAVLVAEGLGPRAEEDFRLARDTCVSLLKIGMTKKKIGEMAPRPYRMEEDHDLFVRLHELLLSSLCDLKNPFWVPLCEKAICTIYTLSENPDHVCEKLIKAIAEKVLVLKTGEATETEGAKPEEATETEASKPEETTETEESKPEEATETGEAKPEEVKTDETKSEVSGCPTGVLVRFLSLIGNIAHRQLEHLDRNVLAEMKRRAALLEKCKSKKKRSKKNQDLTSTAIEEELGLTGASADDDEAEQIRKVCELEVLNGGTLLASVAPLIVSVCRNQAKYSNPELRAAASLTLSKLMLISSEFCEDNLQLLFTILEKSSRPTIRANTIIALGDLAFLFPNLIEPWTANMYARLRDPSPLVRRNTVSVLSHLILNDMVKVKGQISEMATCIIDDDENIQGLAKVFFVELSRKGNAIYNILADIISRLSDPDIGVEEASFQTILKYLFMFIQKDKQSESLVEKLCQRFRVTSTERQWRDLAYCLSLLSYNEKCVRKLQENFGCYADKLALDVLYDYFISILKKAKNKCKIEFKPSIDELEAQLTECHNKGLDDGAAAAAKTYVFKTPAKTAARARKTAQEANKNSKTPMKAKITPRRSTRKLKSQKNKIAYFSSESDSENEPMDKTGSDSDDFVEAPKKSSKVLRSTRKRPLTPLQPMNS